MAIKERKQITGTTAQIDAYAGHEGQIVWDKEKKTFVGMSGTAGNNYPLASQTYVDTQFLPLSGGNITGALHLKFGGQLFQSKDPENNYGYTILTSKGDGALNSCALLLANHDSTEKGSMILRYTDGSGDIHDLYMSGENDEIYWNNRAVETISTFGSNYIRYANGLQIVFARVSIPSSGTVIYNYPVPFVGEVSVVSSQNQTLSINSVDWSATTQCQVSSAWKENEANSSPIVIIGRWR